MIFAGYTLITFSLLSLFIYLRWWIWGPLLVASLLFAFFGHVVGYWGLAAIAILWGSYFLLSEHRNGWTRAFMALIIVALSGALLFHYYPGFQSYILFPGVLSFNYDKVFVGFFALVFYIKRSSPFTAYVRSIPYILGGLLVLLGVAYAASYVHFAPHFPTYFWPWAVRNLFFVSIPEEAFFRGFLQKEITRAIGKKWGWVTGVILSALAFTLIHLEISQDIIYLSVIFGAGLVFGLVYHFAKSIESAILVHFLTNVLHLTVFVS